MYSWIVGRALRVLFARLNAGDLRLILRGFAPDAHLVFPGRSSFAGDHRGRREIGAWLERFVGLGPHFEIHDVAAAGPPWNMRVFFRFSDRIPIPGGGEYSNEGMEYVRMSWGRIREQRVYLDTEKVADFDSRLAAAAESSSAETAA
jgi:ketosteroid isomerase-like protein